MSIKNFSRWFSGKLLSVLFVLAISPTSLVTASGSRQLPVSAYLYLGLLPISSQTQSPRLLTQDNSTRALALSATTFLAEPFSLTQFIAFGTDSRTRVVLFAANIDVPAGENPAALTADAEDWRHSVYPLQVEYVDRLGVTDPTYAIHLRLNDAMVEDGDVLVRLYFNGAPSNRVRVGLGHVGGGLPDDGASQITQLSPTGVTAGGNPLTLSISGSGFTPDAKPFFNGIQHTATVASENLLLVPLSASEVQTAVTYSVHVQTIAGTSNSVSFNVNNPQPTIFGLSPSNVIKGGSGFTLGVSGSGFVQGSLVHFNGSSRVTAFVSATLLTAQILTTDINVAGSFPVRIANSSPGGGDSNIVSLNVTDPSPTPTPSPTPGPSPSTGRYFYVAPNGSPSGDGSSQNPWNLATALNHPLVVRPGDTIWLNGGTYQGTFNSRLTGTAALPIIVRATTGQRVMVDLNTGNTSNSRAFTINGAYTWFWGLEVLDSDPVRSTSIAGSHPSDVPRQASSITVTGPNIKLINIIAHDLANGVRFWEQSVDSEIYGLITYNNGFHGPDRGHGHGIYTQNRLGRKQIREVISFNNFSTGMKAYSETGYATGYLFDGVVSFDNGSPEALFPGSESIRRESNLLVGTIDNPADDIVISNSHFFTKEGTYNANTSLGYRGNNGRIELRNNHLTGGTRLVQLLRWNTVIMTGNFSVLQTAKYPQPKFIEAIPVSGVLPSAYTFNNNSCFDAQNTSASISFHWNAVTGDAPSTFANWRLRTGLDSSSTLAMGRPAGRVMVRPNLYESGRAHIIVYNWNNSSVISVDLSTTGLAAGDDYEIRDVLNFFWHASVLREVRRKSNSAIACKPCGGRSNRNDASPYSYWL